MNKICLNEFLNLSDGKMWCGVGARCLGRSKCQSFVDGSHAEQEERFTLKCEKCGWAGKPNLEESGPHTKAVCGECDAYIKMLSKKDVELLVGSTNTITVGASSMKKAFDIIRTRKSPIMSRGEALDSYIDMRDKIKDIPESRKVIKDSVLVQLSNLAESHSAALSRIEELENKINDPLFGEKATQVRIDKMCDNFRFMLQHMSDMHTLLNLPNSGDWQSRTAMVLNKVKEMTND